MIESLQARNGSNGLGTLRNKSVAHAVARMDAQTASKRWRTAAANASEVFFASPRSMSVFSL